MRAWKLWLVIMGETSFNKGGHWNADKVLVWEAKDFHGDPKAFENYVRECWLKFPKSTVAAFI